MMIIALDPGTTCSGVAVFEMEGPPGSMSTLAMRLRTAFAVYSMTGVKYEMVSLLHGSLKDFKPNRLVVEKPQVYRASKSKGDPNDLIDVALVAGSLMGLFPGVKTYPYKPATWKGQVPKTVMERRIKSRLTDGEMAAVKLRKAKTIDHNIWDAIGLGLHHVGRL